MKVVYDKIDSSVSVEFEFVKCKIRIHQTHEDLVTLPGSVTRLTEFSLDFDELLKLVAHV